MYVSMTPDPDGMALRAGTNMAAPRSLSLYGRAAARTSQYRRTGQYRRTAQRCGSTSLAGRALHGPAQPNGTATAHGYPTRPQPQPSPSPSQAAALPATCRPALDGTAAHMGSEQGSPGSWPLIPFVAFLPTPDPSCHDEPPLLPPAPSARPLSSALTPFDRVVLGTHLPTRPPPGQRRRVHRVGAVHRVGEAACLQRVCCAHRVAEHAVARVVDAHHARVGGAGVQPDAQLQRFAAREGQALERRREKKGTGPGGSSVRLTGCRFVGRMGGVINVEFCEPQRETGRESRTMPYCAVSQPTSAPPPFTAASVSRAMDNMRRRCHAPVPHPLIHTLLLLIHVPHLHRGQHVAGHGQHASQVVGRAVVARHHQVGLARVLNPGVWVNGDRVRG